MKMCVAGGERGAGVRERGEVGEAQGAGATRPLLAAAGAGEAAAAVARLHHGRAGPGAADQKQLRVQGPRRRRQEVPPQTRHQVGTPTCTTSHMYMGVRTFHPMHFQPLTIPSYCIFNRLQFRPELILAI